MVLPTTVDPVNEIFATSGCVLISGPTTSPLPVTMLKTPGGKPAECNACVTICVCSALISLGLTTAVQPAARAAASLPQMKPALLFHGVIKAATPSGCMTTSARPMRRVNSYACNTLAASSNTLAACLAIQRARETGAPYSSTMASNSASSLASTASRKRSSMAMRSAFVDKENVPNARLAAAMARRASCASARRTRPIT